jgi:hypothetical protein
MSVSSEVVAREDAGLGKPRGVEHLAGFDREIREVAAVEPNSRELMPALAELFADLDRVLHALQRVVGVDEEDAVVGQRLRVRLECLGLAVESS